AASGQTAAFQPGEHHRRAGGRSRAAAARRQWRADRTRGAAPARARREQPRTARAGGRGSKTWRPGGEPEGGRGDNEDGNGMKALRRLYGYLTRYKIWAIIAFSSMIVFAATQTVMIALSQPLFDEVLARPGTRVTTRESNAKQWIINTVMKRDLPEGQRGWLINTADRASKRFDAWWNGHPENKWKKVLFA